MILSVCQEQPGVKIDFFFCIVCQNIHLNSNLSSLSNYGLLHITDIFFAVLSPQVGGCANRVHEEQGVGQVFSRAPGIFEALLAPGLLPAQASAEDPEVPPTAARMSSLQHKRTHLHYK